jgi:LPXTG-site transpeptidase (sortase) family protein
MAPRHARPKPPRPRRRRLAFSIGVAGCALGLVGLAVVPVWWGTASVSRPPLLAAAKLPVPAPAQPVPPVVGPVALTGSLVKPIAAEPPRTPGVSADDTAQGDVAAPLTRDALLPDLVRRESRPVRVTAAAASVAADVVPVVARDSGALDVPADPSLISWYAAGPTPGQDGSAVLAGHVRYENEAGVFAHLDRLAVGDTLTVWYADHTHRAFRLAGSKVFPKRALPVSALFSWAGPARLALVTCTGYAPAAGAFLDNLVILAVPVDT